MNSEFQLSQTDFLSLLPMIVLVSSGVLAILLEAFFKPRSQSFIALISVAALMLSAWLMIRYQWNRTETILGGMIKIDMFGVFGSLLLIFAATLTCLSAIGYLHKVGADQGETYGLTLFATAGAMMMIQAADLIMIFIGLETLSIALYVLVAMRIDNPLSSEASLKYFLLGAFTSGILLFGIALIYGGAGGTVALNDIAVAFMDQTVNRHMILLICGTAMVLLGFLFKVAIAPFHMWAPDVYMGAPSTVTAFMATGVKTAAFIVLIRVVAIGFPLQSFKIHLAETLWILAVVSMTIGNLSALVQQNTKRMLAFSSIAHAGYMLIGLIVYLKAPQQFADQGIGSILFYLLAYVTMNVGAFGVIAMISRDNEEGDRIDHLRGLAKNSPLLALVMAIFMLSLAGIPPTVGFMGKFYLFTAGIKAGFVGLVVIALLNSVVSVFYYFRIIMAMYMEDPAMASDKSPSFRICPSLSLAIAGLATVILGLIPAWLLHYALISARTIMN